MTQTEFVDVYETQRTDAVVPYEFRFPSQGSSPVDTGMSTVDMLLQDVFIDKSEVVHNFLQLIPNFMKKIPGHKDSSLPLSIVGPRGLGKTTLLDFIDAVFNPIKDDRFHEVKAKISSLKRGKELLGMGLRPVVRLDMRGVSSVCRLNEHIAESLEAAGLETTEHLFRNNDAPEYLLERGLHELQNAFGRQTLGEDDYGPAKRTIVMVDNCDWPYQQRDCPHDLLEQVRGLYQQSSTPRWHSRVSLFCLVGSTRMAAADDEWHRIEQYQVGFKTWEHGLFGIQRSELLECLGSRLDPQCAAVSTHSSLEDYLDNELVQKWNVFRFAPDPRKVNQHPLLSPVDVWELISALQQKQPPRSRWLDELGKTKTDFSFVDFAKLQECNWEGFQELVACLRGGYVPMELILAVESYNDESDVQSRPAEIRFHRRYDQSRKCYFDCLHKCLHTKESMFMQRVLFELGLLTLRHGNITGNYPHEHVFLAPPNAVVFREALRTLLRTPASTHVWPTPSQQTIRDTLTPEGLQSLADTTATELRDALRFDGETGCEGVMQDYLYFNVLSAFPPTRSATYAVEKDWSVQTKGSDKVSVDLMVYDGEGAYHLFQTALEKRGDVLVETERETLRQRAEDTATQLLNECYVAFRDSCPDEAFRTSDLFYRWAIGGVFDGYGDQSEGYVGHTSIGIRLCGIGTIADEEKRRKDAQASE